MFKSLVLSTTAAVALLLATGSTAQESNTLSFFDNNNLAEVTDYTLPIKRKFTDRNVYTVNMRMGSPNTQNVELVLATNTEWTMVTSVNCTSEFGCAKGIYDARKSDSEIINTDALIYKNISLGVDFELVGYNATDVLYFSNGIDWIDRNFPFFIIETVGNKQNINFPYDGVLGLSPDISGDDYLTLGKPLPLFLKDKGKIKNAIVGIDMHKDSSIDSSITIGKYDVTKFRNKTEKAEDLKWFSVITNNARFAWNHEVKNIFYGEKSFDDGYKNYAVFDSFYGGIHLPQAEWKNTFTEIKKNQTDAGKQYLQCNFDNMTCFYNGECKINKGDWKKFFFNFIDDRAYAVTPESYLLDTKDKEGRNICVIAIYGNKIHPTEYILGDVFMQSLYVVLDYENSRFAVNGDYRTVDALADKPERPSETNSMVWVIISSVAGVLVLVAVVGCFIVRSKNKKLQNNLAKYEQL